ncbi:MAG TPA: DUF6501 family protein [Savagea sp.]
MEIFKTWKSNPTIRTVICSHTNAEKFTVNEKLTVGQSYEVKNETEEFIFIVDNSGEVGGYYKTYFEA